MISLPRPPAARHNLAASILIDAVRQAIHDQNRLVVARRLLRRVLDIEESPKGVYTHAQVEACVAEIKTFLEGDQHVAEE